jgi:hypothetical protein
MARCKNCENCKFSNKNATFTGIYATSMKQLEDIHFKAKTHIEYVQIDGYGWVYALMRDIDSDCCVCDNINSKLYNNVVKLKNSCELYDTKYPRVKKEKTHDEIIENYECEGQMSFT